MTENRLYNIVFNYNSYEDLYYAFPRVYWKEYWNGNLPKGSFLKGKNILHLIEAINNGENIEKTKESISKGSTIQKSKRKK